MTDSTLPMAHLLAKHIANQSLYYLNEVVDNRFRNEFVAVSSKMIVMCWKGDAVSETISNTIKNSIKIFTSSNEWDIDAYCICSRKYLSIFGDFASDVLKQLIADSYCKGNGIVVSCHCLGAVASYTMERHDYIHKAMVEKSREN